VIGQAEGVARPDRLSRVADQMTTAVGRLTVDPGRAVREMASLMFSWVPRGGRAGLLPSQPWTRILFPHEITSPLFGPLVTDAASAAAIPAVARGMQIYTGAIKQMPMDAYRGAVLQPRPRLLEQPDPNAPAGWFTGVQVEDYINNGNALNVITAYDTTGWPAAATWLPAAWCSIGWHPDTPGAVQYLVDGVEIPAERVVHVRRGADRNCPVRGIGIVEQHLRSLERIAGEEAYEQETLSNAAVPSVAVISPNPGLGNDEAVEAKQDWMAKYNGPRRVPAILPAGTQVIPLSWSPDDAQLTEARRMSLLDVANMMNLDGYYLGAPNATLTYQSPGANFSNLLRLSLEPVLKDFEDVWSMMWLPRGQRVRFERIQLTRDDFAATIETLAAAAAAGILTIEEARAYIGLAAGAGPSLLAPTDTEAIPA
jgi:HK97 family phage portal protein